MPSALCGKFASEVLKEVRFKYDHPFIRQELIEHMEELYEDLQAEGMDAEVAEVMAVEYMGDAAEIGQALNREHSPVLGWLWLFTKETVIFLLFILIFSVLPVGEVLLHGIFTEYYEKTDSPLVYVVPLEIEKEAYGEKISLRELRYYADETMEIRGNSLDWTGHWAEVSGIVASMTITDDTGRQYIMKGRNENQPSLGTGIYFRVQMFLEDFPLDAEKLNLCYDWYHGKTIEIDLSDNRIWMLEEEAAE